MEESDQRLLSPWEQYLLGTSRSSPVRRFVDRFLRFSPSTENELPSEPDSEVLAELEDARPSAAEEAEAEESRVELSNASERIEEGMEAETERENEFVARIKYMLATSSLLAPRLELSLYPGPHSSTPPTTSGLERTAPTSTRSTGERAKVEWGAGWENKGTRWNDEGVVRDAGVVSSWIVSYIWHVILLVWTQYVRKETTTAESATKILESPVEAVPPSLESSNGIDLEAGVLETTNRLVSVSQQLDNRISRSLGGIREVEGVGLGLGLSVRSDPLVDLPLTLSVQLGLHVGKFPSVVFPESKSRWLPSRILQHLIAQRRIRSARATGSRPPPRPLQNDLDHLTRLSTSSEITRRISWRVRRRRGGSGITAS